VGGWIVLAFAVIAPGEGIAQPCRAAGESRGRGHEGTS
jgi:hypothetical protein